LTAKNPELHPVSWTPYEETLAWIKRFPEMCSVFESDVPRLQRLRVKPISGFEKYLIFYRLTEQDAFIVRILHGHQDIENLL
jgi:toxin ParE1/3/4